MENTKEYCKCEFAGLINCLSGVDINCHYCGKEVKGMRESFEKSPNFNKYEEVKNGVFEKRGQEKI